MTFEKNGIVTKAVGGVFTVTDGEGDKFVCFSPKKFRYTQSDVIVGDKVVFTNLGKGKGNITRILPRKNRMTRPEVANIDTAFVLVACEPQPDLFLADKILVNCFREHITPVIVLNKSDIADGAFADRIRANYGAVCEITVVSALTGDNLKPLEEYIKGNTVCFAGQSAVGKTSLLNALSPGLGRQTGQLSRKSGRGMHTTRHSEIYSVCGGYVADTAGFSLCDLTEVRSDELKLYLDDIMEVSRACRFTSCTHVNEPDCAVRTAAEKGLLCRERYDRYIAEFNELKENERRKYV